MIRNFLILCSLSIILFSCSTLEPDESGVLTGVKDRTELTVEQVTAISTQALSALGIPDPATNVVAPFQLKYPVELVKVTYSTTNKDGDIVPASGLVIVPQGTEAFPLLSIQHGMVTHHDNVSSNFKLMLESQARPTVELISGLLTASRGYITLVPDYLGFGVSQEKHPFCHRDLTASAVVDMMRAVESGLECFKIDFNDKRFLFGHSQGGYSSIAALDLLESMYADSMALTACAASASPLSLSDMAVDIFTKDPMVDNIYGAYLLTSTIWNGKVGTIAEVFTDSMEGGIADYFDGSYSSTELRAALPTDKDDVFSPEFLSSFVSGTGVGAKYFDEITNHDLIDLSPETRINLFYGENDIHIPGSFNSLKADSAWTANGTPDELVNTVMIPGTDHYSSFVPALLNSVFWFSAM